MVECNGKTQYQTSLEPVPAKAGRQPDDREKLGVFHSATRAKSGQTGSVPLNYDLNEVESPHSERQQGYPMYAIFEDGSRQYRVEEGSAVNIDHREAKIGDTIELTKILLIGKDGSAKIGQPLLAGAKIVAEVISLPRVKTVAQSFRRRKASKRLRGHTQPHVRVKIKQIVG
jgi:large subunit ribosomal protein L21